jgi:hypothetical protein
VIDDRKAGDAARYTDLKNLIIVSLRAFVETSNAMPKVQTK